MSTYDLKEMSSEALNLLSQRVEAEVKRRKLIRDAEAQIDHLVDEVHFAHDREPGDPWVQPTEFI